jgi:hypothetical protein
MAIDHTALATDIQSGPFAATLAPMVTAGNDQGIADLYNKATGVSSGSVVVVFMSRSDFLMGFAPALFSLPTLTNAIQTKWDRILRFIGSLEGIIKVSSGGVQNLLTQAVTDNVLTQNQVNGISNKTGSRAEILFGDGTVLTSIDIARALGRNS